MLTFYGKDAEDPDWVKLCETHDDEDGLDILIDAALQHFSFIVIVNEFNQEVKRFGPTFH